jgi:hypothetical protein
VFSLPYRFGLVIYYFYIYKKKGKEEFRLLASEGVSEEKIEESDDSAENGAA